MDEGDFLGRILARRRELNAAARASRPDRELEAMARDAPPPRGFERALRLGVAKGGPAVIAEMKRASPSKGMIREELDFEGVARAYRDAGACALSVLTEPEFFKGDMRHLRRARGEAGLPALCKDFMVEARQFHEARLAGADCVLLIAAALDDASMMEFRDLAWALGMDVLVEVHNREELTRAIVLKTGLIGINNRDLKSFATSVDVTLGLLADIPEDRLVITESGIAEPAQVRLLRDAGVQAFLVGESLMRAADPGQALRGLFFPAS